LFWGGTYICLNSSGFLGFSAFSDNIIKSGCKGKNIFYIYNAFTKKNMLLWDFEFRGCMKGLGDWKTEDDETGRLVIFIPN
jgi:hypothetical protein